MKYSKVKDKPIHRLKAMQKKLRIITCNVQTIKNHCELYGIPLSEVSKSAIKETVTKTMRLWHKIGLVIRHKQTGKSGIKDIEAYFNSRDY
jgi:hypothetical protein